MATQPPSKFRKKHVVFGDESSDTEYTSAESEEAVAQMDNNCVESQPTNGPHSEIRPGELPTENLAPLSTPHVVILERESINLSDCDEEMDASLQDPEASVVQTPSVKQVEAKKEMVMESQRPNSCSEVPRVSLGQPEECLPLLAMESEDVATISMTEQDVVDVVVPTSIKQNEDEPSTISGNYKSPGLGEMFTPDWSRGVVCDMCEGGPSLSFGAWYSWCCGKPSQGCDCIYEDQQRKRKVLMGKGDKHPKANGDLAQVWSGKVHKLCALWSEEVYQNPDAPWIMMDLESAMRRSRKLKCSDCGRLGATIGCRVRSCKKTYHYPCADRLSSFVEVQMWEGYVKPIVCKNHRHAEVKQKRRRKRRLAQGAGTPRPRENTLNVNEIARGDEEGSLQEPAVIGTPISGLYAHSGALPQPIGKNVLTLDFSYGCEKSMPVPCTNDVDDERPPYMEYLTKTRFRTHSLGSKDCPQPPPERLAKACKGCTQSDLDDPSGPLSIHVPFERREYDYRQDWLEERMYGRLPYDKYGRLLIGTKFNELVECNERCECGELCSNREMQKGLTTPVELYKTENRGWGLRTLVAIARGKFVIEYVGEMMTQDQCQRYGQDSHYTDSLRSYMQELDYPEPKRMPDFILDSYHASNVSRFINHSCDPNLKLYRVYVETTYKWLPHIGFYAIRDIEAGEELAHDYNFGRSEDEGNELEKALTHVKCNCGARNCREWLRVHTETEG